MLGNVAIARGGLKKICSLRGSVRASGKPESTLRISRLSLQRKRDTGKRANGTAAFLFWRMSCWSPKSRNCSARTIVATTGTRGPSATKRNSASRREQRATVARYPNDGDKVQWTLELAAPALRRHGGREPSIPRREAWTGAAVEQGLVVPSTMTSTKAFGSGPLKRPSVARCF
jgi:hypothetical protein